MRLRNNLSASMWLSCFAVMFALFFISLFTTPTMGQSLIAGGISGRVTDPTGAVIPSATVELKSSDTGTTQTDTTNAEGSYRFTLLKPGRYEVSTSVSGFSKVVQTVSVEVGQTTQADFKLEISRAAETIEVSGSAPLVSSGPGKPNSLHSHRSKSTTNGWR